MAYAILPALMLCMYVNAKCQGTRYFAFTFLAEQRSAHAERVLCFCGICNQVSALLTIL